MSITRPPRSTRHLKPDTAGFTLLEVMVAVAVIAIALIPLLRLHLLSLDATLYAQDLTTAVGLAQEIMAKMSSTPEPGEQHGTFDAAVYARFRWQTSVGEKEEVVIPNLELNLEASDSDNNQELPTFDIQHIEVTVLWKDGKREKLYTLESYVAQ